MPGDDIPVESYESEHGQKARLHTEKLFLDWSKEQPEDPPTKGGTTPHTFVEAKELKDNKDKLWTVVSFLFSFFYCCVFSR